MTCKDTRFIHDPGEQFELKTYDDGENNDKMRLSKMVMAKRMSLVYSRQCDR
jgi:hypothetical protein